ncbi:hypothetical protein [Motiliproteus sp.]|uniref:hypothetical protein n=1 Tax=Motiliproteus sp. TaxID=1898955 RepID=UPI003BA96B1B
METKLKNKIQCILSEIGKTNTINYQSLTPLIKYTRELLEFTQNKKRFSTLNFYCNWFLHTRLSQGVWLAKFFESINDTYHDEKARSDNNYFLSQVTSKIAFDLLRYELDHLFDESDIESKIIQDDRFWYAFLSILTDDLIDKKLTFPLDKGSKKTKQRIQTKNNRLSRPVFPEEFYFSNDENNKVKWNIVFSGSENFFPNGFHLVGEASHNLNVSIADNVISYRE